MAGLEMLEVAIGLILVYLVLSLICTSISEAITQMGGLRGKNLRRSIEVLVGEDGLKNDSQKTITKSVFEHPQIKTLSKRKNKLTDERRDPSYIPSDVFAKALLHVATDGEGTRTGAVPSCLKSKLEEFAKKSNSAAQYQFVSKTLLGFFDEAGGDQAGLLKEIQKAFDNTGQRASGWFKRAVNMQLIFAGLAVALLANADTIHIFRLLQEDPGLRSAAVEIASKRVVEKGPKDGDGTTMEQIKKQAGDVQPFLGWTDEDPVVQAWNEGGSTMEMAWAAVIKFLGLVLTAFAISLGAPFWFDLLQKLVKVRQSLKPEEQTAAAAKQEGKLAKAAGVPVGAVKAAGTAANVTGTTAAAETNVVEHEPGYRAGMPGFVPFTAEYQLGNNYWLAAAAALAYKNAEEVTDTCRSWGLETLLPPVEDSRHDTQVFIAADDNIAIVSFRGTEPTKPADILTDARVKQVPPQWEDDPTDALIHEGFRDALNDVWQDITRTLCILERKQAIWLTGHSLGGALAALCAYRLLPWLESHNKQARQKDKKHELLSRVSGVYTIGQPRCGNKSFVEELERRLGGRIIRTINNRDIVPRVPTRMMGYIHAGSVRYIDEFGRLHADPALWFRLLDTLLVSLDEVQGQALETVKDHSAEQYVELLERARA